MAHDNRTSRRRGGNAVEPFVQLPLRLHDALRRGDVDLDIFALIVFLAGECWRNEGEAVFTTAALSELIGYEKTNETLLRKLKHARPDWLDFDVSPRQRQAITFRLTGAAVRQADDLNPEKRRRSGESRPSQNRQSSDETRQSMIAPTPPPERVSEAGSLPYVASPERHRREERREEEKRENPSLVRTEHEGIGRTFDDERFLALLAQRRQSREHEQHQDLERLAERARSAKSHSGTDGAA